MSEAFRALRNAEFISDAEIEPNSRKLRDIRVLVPLRSHESVGDVFGPVAHMSRAAGSKSWKAAIFAIAIRMPFPRIHQFLGSFHIYGATTRILPFAPQL